MIAAAIVGLHASDHVWRRAAAEQRLAMSQMRLRPTTIAVVDYVTERFNRRQGYDWHSAGHLAGVIGCEVRSVKRALEEAGSVGFAKRRRAGSRWETTLPRMFSLCAAVQAQLEACTGAGKGTGKARQGDRKSENRGTGKPDQGDRKFARGTGNSPGGPKRQSRGTKKAISARRHMILI